MVKRVRTRWTVGRKGAQEIYRAAFNSAEDQYGEESRALRVAWAAVEKKYEKNENGDWVEK